MKKLILIISCFLLLVGSAWAISLIGSGVTVSGGDGEIGNTTSDGSTSCFAGYNYHDKFTTITAGDISYGHLRTSQSDSETICLSITSSDGTVLAYGSSAGTSSDGWVNIALNTTMQISAGTTYYLCFQSDGTFAYYKNSAGTEYYYDQSPYDCDGNLGNAEESTVSGSDMTIYFDNNSGDPS